jgi:hypothetical protein
VDIYVFDCSGKECVAAKADGDVTGDEVVVVQNPAAGKWKIVVDASRAATPAAFAYEDVVFNPAFGHVTVTDQPKEREIGAPREIPPGALVRYCGPTMRLRCA